MQKEDDRFDCNFRKTNRELSKAVNLQGLYFILRQFPSPFCCIQRFFFFFNDTATTEIYTSIDIFPYTTLFRSRPSRVRPARASESNPVHVAASGPRATS